MKKRFACLYCAIISMFMMSVCLFLCGCRSSYSITHFGLSDAYERELANNDFLIAMEAEIQRNAQPKLNMIPSGRRPKLLSTVHRMQDTICGLQLALAENIFQTDYTVLTPEGRVLLDVVLSSLLEYREAWIDVQVYTGDGSSPTANLRLSRQRVEMISAYLVRKGIEPERIKGKEGRSLQDSTIAGDAESVTLADNQIEFHIY